MYVSRLDRPWLETRYLFQGFHISITRDIAPTMRITAKICSRRRTRHCIVPVSNNYTIVHSTLPFD